MKLLTNMHIANIFQAIHMDVAKIFALTIRCTQVQSKFSVQAKMATFIVYTVYTVNKTYRCEIIPLQAPVNFYIVLHRVRISAMLGTYLSLSSLIILHNAICHISAVSVSHKYS